MTMPAQAILDPYVYAKNLAEAFVLHGGRIYVNSRVRSISTQSVATETGVVHAPFVIIATHFPIINFPGWYFLRARQMRSHIAAVSGIPHFDGMYQFIGDGGLSLRRADGLTLISDAVYPCGRQTNVDHDVLLRNKTEALFADGNILSSWHGQDVFSADGLPFAGPYSRRTPNHFVAAGFSQWGITNSMAAAQAISARILGYAMPESEIFDPSRTMKYSARSILSAICITSGTYLHSLTQRHAPKCTHMGCRLKYVSSTDSWDCPCHGSRFDSIGRVKNGPAVRSVIIQNKNRPDRSS